MRVELDDLVDALEIAKRLGVKRLQVVHTWAVRFPSFPRPVKKFGRFHLWLWPDVKNWAAQTRRLIDDAPAQLPRGRRRSSTL